METGYYEIEGESNPVWVQIMPYYGLMYYKNDEEGWALLEKERIIRPTRSILHK